MRPHEVPTFLANVGKWEKWTQLLSHPSAYQQFFFCVSSFFPIIWWHLFWKCVVASWLEYHFTLCCRFAVCVHSVARMGEERGVHRLLVGKPEGKRPLGRPRRRWEDNIKMDVQEVEGGRGDWMELAQDRDRWQALVSTVKNLRVP
jgi:hypothetical protein